LLSDFSAYSKPDCKQERVSYIKMLLTDCLSQFTLNDGGNVIVGDMNCGEID